LFLQYSNQYQIQIAITVALKDKRAIFEVLFYRPFFFLKKTKDDKYCFFVIIFGIIKIVKNVYFFKEEGCL
jgi:hypothetical protein